MDFSNREALAESTSEDGTVTLEWAKTDETEIIVQQSASPEFAEPIDRYQGLDSASVLTGLAEGTYYFRIGEANTGNWSEPLEVTVKFFPRGKLWLILSTGAVVVMATIITIIAGHFRSQQREPES